MVFKRIAAVLLWLLVTLTSAFGFMASELEIASGDFFCETVVPAEQNDPGTRNLCRENGWLNYDTTSGYCVAANKIDDLPLQGPPNAKVRTSNRPGNQQAVELQNVDGSVKDISPTRVKEFVPNTHPNAPPGALNPVKFDNALPGSKGKKRAPTQGELDILRRATGG